MTSKENKRLYQKEYMQTYIQENREKMNLAKIKYNNAHPEVNRNWKIKNMDKVRHNKMRYRAKQQGVKGSHTLAQWEEMKRLYGFMCLCCKWVEPEILLTRDHIIPISKGGTNNIENIQPLCMTCNNLKRVKTTNYILKGKGVLN